MATIREILVDWTTQAGGGFRNVFYFDSTVTPAVQRSDIATWATGMAGVIDTNVSWTVETAGRELDETTGALVGAWTEPTGHTGLGAITGECVPDVAQILCRWATGSVVGGRFLKGRSFVPGMTVAQMKDGNIVPATVGALSTVCNTFATGASNLLVWHRPVLGAGGVAIPSQSGSVWSELAVLRRRRG